MDYDNWLGSAYDWKADYDEANPLSFVLEEYEKACEFEEVEPYLDIAETIWEKEDDVTGQQIFERLHSTK